jgi:precorrin-6A synthase
MSERDCGAFLVWGDPSLYDGTLRILANIKARGALDLEYESIPGISSVQALAARHGVPLNRIGGSILVTTARRAAEGLPGDADSVVVMLDGEGVFRKLPADLDIYWGAYVGTEDEVFVSGRLGDVVDEIERVRERARAEKGWIMDTYLLTKGRKGAAEE